jgi:hypothetical protein
MQLPVAATAISLFGFAYGMAYGETVSDNANPETKPRVYALVAAVGEHFDQVHEVSSTGSHLSPYRHKASMVSNNLLNRLALHSLDKAIATIDPAGTRIYLALPPAQMDGVAPWERDNVAIAAVLAALEKMPQRMEWDRIVVATPAYRGLTQNGMASKLQGFGIFNQQLCQGGCGSPFVPGPGPALAPEPPDGIDAITMDDTPIKARTFIAPFSYIDVWVLDPKTLAVLDKQQGFDSQKLAEPSYKQPLNISDADMQKYVARRFVNLVELSIGEAVMHSEVNLLPGKVEVGPVKVIEPDDAKK